MKSIGILLLVAAGTFGSPSSKVESKLIDTIKASGSANVFISFQVGTKDPLNSVSSQKFASRAEKITGVNSRLRAHANLTQERILSFLEKGNIESFTSFWITNQIYVKNASPSLISALAAFPEVSEITQEKTAYIQLPTNLTPSPLFAGELTWGLIKIQAADVWNLEGGNQGEGVVVGGIDTGVRYTHEALKDNFRGDYGWFDPAGGSLTPYDRDGHGTHTIGTLVGSKGVGVAPKATWMACTALDGNEWSEFSLVSCGQFMQCPTLANGSDADCSKAPKIVSNSWGLYGGDSFYNDIVEAWVASEIVPVFSNGNRYLSEPICGGVGAPADHPLSIAVGNTNIDDGLAPTSDQGPTISGVIKPDISGPGTDVISAWIDSDTAYFSGTGTSMAAPHVAGVAALLLSRKPDLTVAEIKNYLIHGVEQAGLNKPGNNCDGVSDNVFPNNAFGHGRISAINSFKKLVRDGN